ncbi:hypothetical protein Dsin_015533 [Dipteronia sinensis]|uniref:Polyprotein n=1 Tax=Dipteronia sinensis TaxID=43782 RepID=A0AAE0ACL4_9ROSI|nr:hypothetical protein Dsin_015533 [Dipteronia sinensis]
MARRITHLVQQRRPPIKEYVQSTALDNCLIPETSAEQYVDLKIGQPLIDQWIREGYSHLHIGAVRIILTIHGRKGLPVTARIALLNTIFKDYEQAIIGTCLSTLHAGSISLTYYSNFNIPLRVNNLHNCLKVQLHLMGHSGDTIFIKAEREDEVPAIIQISKQLPKDQFIELMPLSWITNYEKAFQNTVPVIASDTTYTRQSDGTIKTVYKPLTDVQASHSEVAPSAPPHPPSDPHVFQSLLIRPITFEADIPIHSFEADSSAIYIDKINSHFLWDVDPFMCDPDCSCRQFSWRTLHPPYRPVRRPHSPDDSDSP